jgi:hypothetical protein
MALDLPSFAEIQQADVDQLVDELAARIAEENPNVQVRHGVLRSLVIRFAAAGIAGVKLRIDQYLAARSLLVANADPAAADAATIDNIVANFNWVRRPAANARGSVTVIVDAARSVTIAAGALFDIGGVVFEAESVVQAKPEEELVDAETDQVLTPTSDGNWAFSVPVVAAVAGASGLVRRDTLATPGSPPLGYVNAYAAADFAVGADQETTGELLERVKLGVTSKTPGHRLGLAAVITANSGFSDVQAVSTISGGDIEMLRSRHGLFPIAGGGRTDVYVRTQLRLLGGAQSVVCRLLSKDAANRSTWTCSLEPSIAAGLYEIQGFRTTGGQTVFPALSETRSWNHAAEQDVQSRVEGDFSALQTLTLTFQDSQTATAALTLGDEASYELLFTGVPKIAALQTLLDDRDIRPYGSDVLVRAPVPCFLSVIVSIRKRVTYRNLDEAAVRSAVADAVNRVGFVGAVYAGQIIAAAQTVFTDIAVVSGLDLRGRILAPGGAEYTLRDPFVLAVPDRPDKCVTARTVQFFLDPEDVQLAVENSGAI